MARTATSKFPHLVLDVSPAAIDAITTDSGEHPVTLDLVATGDEVQVLHAGSVIGTTDPIDGADLLRHVPGLDHGVQVSGLVVRRRDGSAVVRFTTAVLHAINTEPTQQQRPNADLAQWIASTSDQLRQIQRWVGWIVALIVIYIALQFLSGVLVALLEDPEPQPQWPAPTEPR